MPRHEEQATLGYSADELFAVVADVKDYPLFVPWCSGARVRHADEHAITADLVIGFGLFQESFTSEVTLDRPRQVLVRAIDGPLEHLTNSWTLVLSARLQKMDRQHRPQSVEQRRYAPIMSARILPATESMKADTANGRRARLG
jgi:ribosome-associated toxin RatA of RatAB toxin-antitoxin module